MLIMAFCSIPAQAKQWTLQDCIDYATANSIVIQQAKNAAEESYIDVKSSKAELFPTLSFSTGHNITNRPYQENSNTVSGTEIISSNNKTTYSGNYGLNAQWIIWNGNKRRNSIKQKKTSSQIAELSIAEQQNLLKEQITQIFIQILYADESIKINQNTLNVSKASYERAEGLFKEGSISKADLAQLNAQLSNDEYQLVSSESALRNYKLQLKQLLEIENNEEIDLCLTDIDEQSIIKKLPNVEEVYRKAVQLRPEIKSGKLDIENSKINMSIAKSGYLPTVSLNASTGSTTNSSSSNSWGKQFKLGWNNMIGISLSIPIFDNRQNKSAIEKASVYYQNSMLELINKQKELYKSIEGFWLEATNAQKQYLAAKAKTNSCLASYEMVSEQFNLGMKNTVELLTEKNNLLNAQQQEIQAKYMVLLNRTLLNFYANQIIEL